MFKISLLNHIATLLPCCLRFATVITNSHLRLVTDSWLYLNHTGFPPDRLISFRWSHNWNLSVNYSTSHCHLLFVPKNIISVTPSTLISSLFFTITSFRHALKLFFMHSSDTTTLYNLPMHNLKYQ